MIGVLDQTALQLKRRGKWERFKGGLKALFSPQAKFKGEANRRRTERREAGAALFNVLERPFLSEAQRDRPNEWGARAEVGSNARKLTARVDEGLQPVATDEILGRGPIDDSRGRYVAPTMEDLLGDSQPIDDPRPKSYESVDLNAKDVPVGKPPQKPGGLSELREQNSFELPPNSSFVSQGYQADDGFEGQPRGLFNQLVAERLSEDQ